MIPNASELARRRHTLITVFRLLALIPLGLTLPVLGIGTYFVFESILYDYFDWTEVVLPAVLILTGLGAAAASWFLLPMCSGLFVPRTRELRCPFCTYQLHGLTEPRCPECGQPLTPEFMGLPPAHDPAHAPSQAIAQSTEPPQIGVERMRATMTAVARLTGFVVASASALITMGFLLSTIIASELGSGQSWLILLIWSLCFGLLALPLGLLPLLFPARMARWLVPPLRPDDPRLKPPAHGPQSPSPEPDRRLEPGETAA